MFLWVTVQDFWDNLRTFTKKQRLKKGPSRKTHIFGSPPSLCLSKAWVYAELLHDFDLIISEGKKFWVVLKVMATGQMKMLKLPMAATKKKKVCSVFIYAFFKNFLLFKFRNFLFFQNLAVFTSLFYAFFKLFFIFFIFIVFGSFSFLIFFFFLNFYSIWKFFFFDFFFFLIFIVSF